jgi:hypothetical protein
MMIEDEALTELVAMGKNLGPEVTFFTVQRACPACGADVRVTAVTDDAECVGACGWAGWLGDLDDWED